MSAAFLVAMTNLTRVHKEGWPGLIQCVHIIVGYQAARAQGILSNCICSQEAERDTGIWLTSFPSPSQGIVPSMFRASTQISPIKKLSQPLAEVCFLGDLEPIKWAVYLGLGLGVNLHSGTLAQTLGTPQLYTTKCGLLTFSEFYLYECMDMCTGEGQKRGDLEVEFQVLVSSLVGVVGTN